MPFRSGTGGSGSDQTGQGNRLEHSQTSQLIGNVPPPYAKTEEENDTCPSCNKTVINEGILCEGCCTWFHQSCSSLSIVTFKQLASSREAWFCNDCQQINRCYPIVSQEVDVVINVSSEPVEIETCPTVSQTISALRQSSDTRAVPQSETTLSPVGSTEQDERASDNVDICGHCRKGQGCRSARWVECAECLTWYHISCAGVNVKQFEAISNSESEWICKKCKNDGQMETTKLCNVM